MNRASMRDEMINECLTRAHFEKAEEVKKKNKEIEMR